MSEHIRGLHSLTGITGAPQAAIEFAVRTLGLRLVKRTVNFDDPQTYHLMFGNPYGEIGSIVGFFPWRGAGAAYLGNGGTASIAFRVPAGSLPYWQERLAANETQATITGSTLQFTDPFDVPWELQEDPQVTEASAPSVWNGSSVEKAHALLGLGEVPHTTPDPEATQAFFAALGLEVSGSNEQFRVQFANDGTAASAASLSFVLQEGRQDARHGAGSILKTTLAVRNEEGLHFLREELLENGLQPSTVRNRLYWKAFFIQEPGGAVLEFATTAPGLTADEPLDELGLAFRLPEWLEQDREFLRGRLPVTASPEYADMFNK